MTDGADGVAARRRHPSIAGAAAGMITVLGFTVLHQLIISDIWFSFVPMLVAGAVCGAALAWSYVVLERPGTPSTWWAYVAVHTATLLLLGVASVLAFDPVVPMAVVVAANEPPTGLIARAMPLTAAFTVAAAGALSLLWGRSLPKFSASLVASAILVTLLGLNVSALGLVRLSGDGAWVVAEFLALIVVIMLGFGLAFLALERRSLFGR